MDYGVIFIADSKNKLQHIRISFKKQTIVQ